MITVFTPAYNRSDKLHRVYDSLLSQTYKNFEWIIVDDGSVDNTTDVVNNFKKAAPFDIIFFQFQENKGKHVATNKALELANGDFFIVADSDDAFTPDALRFFIEKWNDIPPNEREDYCGIRACCEDQNGKRISDVLKEEPLICSMADAFYIHGFRKESWCMVRTDLHRRYLFPENHRGYFPEGIIWKAISRDKKLAFYNIIIRIYYIDEPGESIMSAKIPYHKKVSRNLVSTFDVLNNDIGYFKYDMLYFIKTAIIFTFYSLISGGLFHNTKKLTSTRAKLLVIGLLPVSLVMYVYKKWITGDS